MDYIKKGVSPLLTDFGLSHTSFKVHLCKSMHEIFFFLLFLSMPLDLESSHWLSSAAVTEVNFNLALTLVSNIFAKSILFLAQLFQKKFRN